MKKQCTVKCTVVSNNQCTVLLVVVPLLAHTQYDRIIGEFIGVNHSQFALTQAYDIFGWMDVELFTVWHVCIVYSCVSFSHCSLS